MTESDQSNSPKKKKDPFVEELDKNLQGLEEWENLSDKERSKRQKTAEIRDENKYAWWKVNPATKALIVVNGILTLVLIVITAITVIQQNKTNSLTEENLDLIQQEFELNSRPYISIESSKYEKNKDTLNITFIVKNYGNIPGKISLKKIPVFTKPYKSKIDIKPEVTIIYPNHSLDFHQLFIYHDTTVLDKLQIEITYTPIYSSIKKFETNLLFEIDHAHHTLKIVDSDGN